MKESSHSLTHFMLSFSHPRARTSRDLILLLRLPLWHTQSWHTAAAGHQPWGRRAVLLQTPAPSSPALGLASAGERVRRSPAARGLGHGPEEGEEQPRRGTARPPGRARLRGPRGRSRERLGTGEETSQSRVLP